MGGLQDKKWKLFERLVAAIHKAESEGAEAKWDDRINGRQFDVTLRFKHGLYHYLTVVECKDKAAGVPIEDVEAFVTKARDVGANKAVMVSSTKFQSGCLEVARRHSVDLFTLKELATVPPGYLSSELVTAVQVHAVEIDSADGKTVPVRDEGGSLPYYMQHTVVRTDGTESPILGFVRSSIVRSMNIIDSKSKEFRVKFPTNTRIRLPHNDGEFLAPSLRFKAKITQAGVLREPMDPALIPRSYMFRDELAGTQKEILDQGIGLGHETVLTAGKFYVNPSLSFYYHCRSNDGRLANLILIESYQHGMLWQAQFEQEAKYASHYVEVKDSAVLRRLNYLLSRLKGAD